LVEFAGRICYLSLGDKQSEKTNKEYIANLIAQGHESVLEHASFTVLADGISRALSHQLVRHRVGFSYSQLSQQYHDELNANFVLPAEIDINSAAAKTISRAVEMARSAYATITQEMAESEFGRFLPQKERNRAIRSIARSVLPNATVTTLVVTGNARAWRHMLALRGAIAGDLEMRAYCVECLRLFESEAPALFADFELAEDEMGRFVRRVE
jgi:thymidylate synthase (FAD)